MVRRPTGRRRGLRGRCRGEGGDPRGHSTRRRLRGRGASARARRPGGHHRLPSGRGSPDGAHRGARSEEHTSELQSRLHLVCRLLLEKKKKTIKQKNVRAKYIQAVL